MGGGGGVCERRMEEGDVRGGWRKDERWRRGM